MKQTREQVQSMCVDFLRMKLGMVFDPIEAASRMQQEWGIKVDWHEMSDALEHIRSYGGAVYDGYTGDGMHRYFIEPRRA